jgi:hypothetical protein
MKNTKKMLSIIISVVICAVAVNHGYAQDTSNNINRTNPNNNYNTPSNPQTTNPITTIP